MSVVVDYEESKYHNANARLLSKMFEQETVDHLLALRSQRHYHLLARVSGVLLGSLVAVSLDGANAGIVQVLAIAVEPRQRHHRIAMGLLKAVVEEARRESRNHVITIGPRARFETLGWTKLQGLSPDRYPVHNYEEADLPLQEWYSTPTRTFMPRPLGRIPAPEALYDRGLIIRPNTHQTAKPLPPLSR